MRTPGTLDDFAASLLATGVTPAAAVAVTDRDGLDLRRHVRRRGSRRPLEPGLDRQVLHGHPGAAAGGRRAARPARTGDRRAAVVAGADGPRAAHPAPPAHPYGRPGAGPGDRQRVELRRDRPGRAAQRAGGVELLVLERRLPHARRDDQPRRRPAVPGAGRRADLRAGRHAPLAGGDHQRHPPRDGAGSRRPLRRPPVATRAGPGGGRVGRERRGRRLHLHAARGLRRLRPDAAAPRRRGARTRVVRA